MRTLVSTLLAALLAVSARSETIHYYLHDAVIGSDPNHAVNAAVTGRFDVDGATGRLATGLGQGGISFWDNGYHANYSPSRAGDLDFEVNGGTANSVALLGLQYEKYILLTGQVTFTAPFAGDPVNLDLTRSFVRITECTAPGPGGCNGVAHDVDLYFTSGHVSILQVEAHAPEPGTWLSGTCGCLLAWRWTRRRCRR